VVHEIPGTTRRRPARRTVWLPSAGKACGIAAYTERLLRNLPAAHLTATEPPFDGPGIVHVQHQHVLIDDARLERFVTRAAARRTAVAITEHAVAQRPSTWEPRAAALVAATREGAARLRARNPDVAVVHIPLGCETWSFPRKRERGRTVGFFGFSGIHKGCARLADALRRVPGCDVLAFAHDPPHNRLAGLDWPAEVRVRWHSDWLPLQDIAAALAAAADVLVFHYDEVAESSASSAVLVGMSTGVPVLTSATSWFADLGGAVHRAPVHGDALATELERLLEDDDLRERTTAAAHQYCEDNSWSRTAARHADLWNSLKPV
jgi:glycosyltransferase involved in cell wall biosynthesis